MFQRLPPLNSLRAFEVVCRHSTFRDAARELHVTAAAVGQHIKLLEKHVGHQLLRRHSGGYELTPRGQAAMADLCDAFARLTSAAKKMSEGVPRALTVSTTPSLAAAWLVPRLHKFERRCPHIALMIHSSEEVADLETSRVDVALRYGSGVYSRSESTLLFDGDLFPVCSPHFVSGKTAIRSPSDLRGRPLLHVDWRPTKGTWPGWSSWLEAAGVEGIDHHKGLRFSDQALAIQAAVAGQGLVLGTTALATDHLKARRLVRPFKISIATDFAYFIVTSKSRATDPDIAAFKQWVLSEAQSESAVTQKRTNGD